MKKLFVFCVLAISSLLWPMDARAEKVWESAYDFCDKNEQGVMIYYKIISESEKTVAVGFDGEIGVDGDTHEVRVNSWETMYKDDIVIPATAQHNGVTYNVVSINKEGLWTQYMTSFKANHVTSVGDQGFFSCVELTYVELLNVETIGMQAFCFCNNLQTVKLGSKVKSLGYSIFSYINNSGPKDLYIGSLTPPDCYYGYAFDGFDTGACTLHVQPTVVDIYRNTPYWSDFKNIVGDYEIDEPVSDFTENDIRYHVLSESDRTCEVTYNGVWDSYSGSPSFYNIISGSLTIPASVQYGGKEYIVTAIGDNAFEGNDISSVSLPNTITRIGFAAFADNKNLQQVTVPNSVTDMGQSVFWGCTSLSSVTLSQNLKALEYGTFSYTAIETITIPASVTSINTNPFMRSNKLKNIVLESDACYIFKDGYLLTSDGKRAVLSIQTANAVIPDGVEVLGQYALCGMESLETLFVPEGVTTIEYYAFNNCPNIKTIDLPGTLQYIDPLYMLELGDSLNAIYLRAATPPAFKYTYEWAQEYYEDNPCWMWAWDYGTQSAKDMSSFTIYVPVESVGDYKAAQKWNEFNILPMDYTGIKPIGEIAEQGSMAVYDLSGRRTSEPKKGLYIVNGRKVLIK